MPLWEHIPDGEPYVFEDPDQPGKQRVYVYGSHDDLITEYCGRDQVAWSASVDSLNNWRYDGVILVVDKNAKGEPFDSAGTADVLYAPDVTLVTDANGKKTYYLFPNDQTGFRNGLIAKSDRPDGPFEVCNWNAENPNQVDGVLQFDPAVFVDDDGRVYGYWGFERSYAAEFDPATMATVQHPTTRWPMPIATIPLALGPMAAPSSTVVPARRMSRATPSPLPRLMAIPTALSVR